MELLIELLEKYEVRLGSEISAIDDKIRMYQDAIDKLTVEREALADDRDVVTDALENLA